MPKDNKLQDMQTCQNRQTRVCCSWFLHVKSKLRIKFAYLVFIIFDPSLLHGLVSNTNSILCWSYWYKRYGHHSTIQPNIQDFNWYICYLDSTGISQKTSQVGYRFGFFVTHDIQLKIVGVLLSYVLKQLKQIYTVKHILFLYLNIQYSLKFIRVL